MTHSEASGFTRAAGGDPAADATPAAATMQLGDVSVTRVREYYGPVDLTPAAFFPDSPATLWDDVEPEFLDPVTNVVNAAIQTWVLRSEGRTILVDTGVGNHKERPYAQVWAHHDSGFLASLARAGVRPEEVDVVINTHLHIDHVGWNTRLEDRAWVPTFPNATYLMPRADFDFWNPANNRPTVLGRGNQNVFEDSVAPVHRSGQALLWEGSHRIDGNLLLEPAPGHTPGSSVLTLRSGVDRALFVGDLVHSPVQVLHPHVNSCFCEDAGAARATRRRLLGRAADTGLLVFPAHLPGGGALEVARDADRFAITTWAAFG